MSPTAIALIPTTSPMKPLHLQRGPRRRRLVPRPLWRIERPLACAGLPGRLSQARVMGVPGVDWRGLNLDVKEGNTIEYRDEDPHIRKMFQEQLAKEGAEFNMPEEGYQ